MRSVPTAGIVGIALSAIIALLPLILTSDLSGGNPRTKPATLIGGQTLSTNTGLPIFLTIPKIGVDAAITYVGLTPSGAMGVPEDPDDVVWYKFGPRPGEIGSSVIAGHSGWKDGTPAVFDKLSALKIGDKIYVANTKETMTFVVRELRMYDENADAANVFGSSDGKAHLNLVTCEGVWDTVSESYSDRFVVFTDRE